MTGICEGRVVIVTGAGRGIGRGHALEFARQGAQVVVNDLGAALDGTGGRLGPGRRGRRGDPGDGRRGRRQRRRRRRLGRARSASSAPRSTTFGRLDVLVNNAGFLRDRMFANAAEDEWDAVIRVHLKGHFAPARHAAAHWRDRAKAGEPVDARIINTSSGAGLMGSVGQGTYSAAKAGIAALTLVQAAELGRYGVTANAIAPAARTRMTEEVFAETMAAPDDAAAFDAMAPGEHLAARRVARLDRVGRRHRAGVRGRGRQGLASPTAGGTARRSTRAPAGSPPRSAPRSASCSPRRPPPTPVYGA